MISDIVTSETMMKYFKRQIWVAPLLFVIAVCPDSAAARNAIETCSRIGKSVEGKTLLLPDPIQVMALTKGKDFVLPESKGWNTEAIECWRESIIPDTNDYKVLQAGYPLGIVAKNSKGKLRVAWLEVENGVLQLKFSEGELEAAEIKSVQKRLDQLQSDFQNTSNH